MTTQSSSLRFADRLANNPYSIHGCYPFFAATNDGAAMCNECCRDHRESIALTTGTDGWTIVGLDVNWEDPLLYCDSCGSRIESAYAEDEAVALHHNG